MLADHLYVFFPDRFPEWLHPATRFVAPVFAFLIVEGYYHTSNRVKYGLRLWLGAAGMFLLRILLELTAGVTIHNNIFYTLALGYTAVCCVARGKDARDSGRWYLFALALVLLGALTAEGGMSVLPFMLLCVLFREKKGAWAVACIGWGCLLFGAEYLAAQVQGQNVWDTLLWRSDFLFPMALPLLWCYNGRRGCAKSAAKWGFYGFYPAHIAILAIASAIGI